MFPVMDAATSCRSPVTALASGGPISLQSSATGLMLMPQCARIAGGAIAMEANRESVRGAGGCGLHICVSLCGCVITLCKE